MRFLVAVFISLALVLAVSAKPFEDNTPMAPKQPVQTPPGETQEEALPEGDSKDESEEPTEPLAEGDSNDEDEEPSDVEQDDTSVAEEGKEVVEAPRNSAEKVAEQKAEQHADLFEGDIKLTGKQKKELKESLSGKKETITGQGRPFIGKKWPNGRVPYEFSRGFDNARRETVRAAIKRFNDKTCIRFVEKKPEDKTWVKFIVDDQMCYSRLGHVSMRGQPISIGNGCNYIGTVMHEMMHCIGFFHEQSRRDREEHVEILEDNIDTRRYGSNIKSNFAMYQRGEGDSLGEPYDLLSLMHYPKTAFGKRNSRGGYMTTIRSRTNPNMELGQRIGFSESDLRQINALYSCKKSG